MTVQPGTVIEGRYQIERQIGTGGMASVWLANDRLLGRPVAVKILSDRYASDPDFVERFRREASAAAKLSHSNIVAVFDRGEYEGNYYIVMEYLPGPDLKRIIREQGPLDPRNAVDAALQILSALGAAHKHDVIHRDVKPQNVMVSEDGQLKVTDFGIARAGDDADMTEAGSVIGTAQYLSPEQARGDDVTTASDCYSVGIVLYEMLTGRVPFDGDTPVAVAMRQVNEPPVAPRLLVPSIPEDLNGIVMRALEKRPGARYRTAQEFRDALLSVRRHLPEPDDRTAILAPVDPPTRVIPAVRPPERTEETVPRGRTLNTTPPPAAEPPGKSRRGRIALIVILALALVGGATAFILGTRNTGVTIPTVNGQPADMARQVLKSAGFEVTDDQRYDLTVPLGQVVRTDPAGGKKADRGSTVTMIVSKGQETGTVPDVSGMTWDVARQTLEDADFPARKTEASDKDVPSGQVISQSPDGGSTQPKGTQVTVTISTGPRIVTVPDLSLVRKDVAIARLENAKLVADVRERESSQRGPGLVIGQDPTRGTKVDEGSTVTIFVSVAPPSTTTTTTTTTTGATTANLVAVPRLLGSSYQDAATKLKAVGLPAAISDGTIPGSEPEGTVVRQSPAPGTQVDPTKAQITITVSDGTGSAPALTG